MTVQTERLTLRPVEAGDWQSIKEIWDDQKRSEYARFDNLKDTDPNVVKARIERWASFAGSEDHMFFAVCLEGRVIGYAAFNRRGNGFELGYCFHSDFHGKGYARESISALISHIRSENPDAVISAGTALENTPSVKFLLALGFKQTGTEQISFYKDAQGKDIYFEGGIFELF